MNSSEKNCQQANKAISLLKEGIKNQSKTKILTAISFVEEPNFSWDNLNVSYDEWDKMTDEALDILYDNL